jgi:hypothetical protein
MLHTLEVFLIGFQYVTNTNVGRARKLNIYAGGNWRHLAADLNTEFRWVLLFNRCYIAESNLCCP